MSNHHMALGVVCLFFASLWGFLSFLEKNEERSNRNLIISNVWIAAMMILAGFVNP